MGSLVFADSRPGQVLRGVPGAWSASAEAGAGGAEGTRAGFRAKGGERHDRRHPNGARGEPLPERPCAPSAARCRVRPEPSRPPPATRAAPLATTLAPPPPRPEAAAPRTAPRARLAAGAQPGCAQRLAGSPARARRARGWGLTGCRPARARRNRSLGPSAWPVPWTLVTPGRPSSGVGGACADPE